MPKSIATSNANSKVRPYTKSLKVYHANHGTFPENLAALNSMQKNLKSSEESENGIQWSISYKKVDPDSYTMEFNHAFYDVNYITGKHLSTEVNCWR